MKSLSSADPALPGSLDGLVRRADLWPLLFIATWELALARLALGQREARDLIGFDRAVVLPRGDPKMDLPQRVAWVIPRIAARAPWRADCLVQAMAARRWLARDGFRTELCIGTRKDHEEGFEAHAWLCHGEDVIIGGDVSGFVPLITAEPAFRPPDRNKS